MNVNSTDIFNFTSLGFDKSKNANPLIYGENFSDYLNEAVITLENTNKEKLETPCNCEFERELCDCTISEEIDSEKTLSCDDCKHKENCCKYNQDRVDSQEKGFNANTNNTISRLRKSNEQENINIIGSSSFIYNYNHIYTYITRKPHTDE